MKLLGALEKPFYAAVNPLVKRLIRAGVRPNTITTIGTGWCSCRRWRTPSGTSGWAGLLLLLSGVADTLDGQVARGGAHGDEVWRLLRLHPRPGRRRRHLHRHRRLPAAPRPMWPSGLSAVILCMIAILVLAARLLRPRAGGRARTRLQGGHRPAGRTHHRARARLGCSWAPVRHAPPRGHRGAAGPASTITVVQRFVYVYRDRRPGRAPAPCGPRGSSGARRRWTPRERTLEVPRTTARPDRAGERQARRPARRPRRRRVDLHRRRRARPPRHGAARSARSPRWARSASASAPRTARR